MISSCHAVSLKHVPFALSHVLYIPFVLTRFQKVQETSDEWIIPLRLNTKLNPRTQKPIRLAIFWTEIWIWQRHGIVLDKSTWRIRTTSAVAVGSCEGLGAGFNRETERQLEELSHSSVIGGTVITYLASDKTEENVLQKKTGKYWSESASMRELLKGERPALLKWTVDTTSL